MRHSRNDANILLPAFARQRHPRDPHTNRHRVRARHVPRAGVDNARRPGPRPGRSKAKSIDDAKHGTSIKDAMVSGAKTDLPNATFFRERLPRERTRSASGSRTALSRQAWTWSCHAGGAFVGHVLSTDDSDRGYVQRWRERPRRGALGPPSGQDSGVAHATVLLLATAPTVAPPCGRHRAPPENDWLQPARRSAVVECAHRVRVA
jgi:hypothetical protein